MELTLSFHQASYEDELKAAKDFGPEAQEKLKYPLEGTNFSVIFDDAHTVHLIPLLSALLFFLALTRSFL
jgi:hypothetical protein